VTHLSDSKLQRIFEIRKKKKDLILQKISQKSSFIKIKVVSLHQSLKMRIAYA